MSKSNYRVVGPRGEGPFEVQAESAIEAAAKAGLNYGLNQPRGPHGVVVGYDLPVDSAAAKVGAFDITWLSHADA